MNRGPGHRIAMGTACTMANLVKALGVGLPQANENVDLDFRMGRTGCSISCANQLRQSAMTTPIYRGVFPVAPTVFNENGELDLEGQKRCTDFMIDAGS